MVTLFIEVFHLSSAVLVLNESLQTALYMILWICMILFITCYKDLCLLHYFVILWLFPILIFMQWMPELRRFAPNVPIVLVGTKLGMQLSSLSLPC